MQLWHVHAIVHMFPVNLHIAGGLDRAFSVVWTSSVTQQVFEFIFVACMQGEQVTWAKLSAIEANCGIETTLDACMLRLSEVSAAKRRVRARRLFWLLLLATSHPRARTVPASGGVHAEIVEYSSV